MRQQLSLFPVISKPLHLALEASSCQDDDVVKIDPKFEKTLPEFLQFHPDSYKMLAAGNSRLGDWAEGKVRDIALSLGAEVYQNVSCVGPADMALCVEGNLFLIDVKIAARRLDQSATRPNWYQRKSNLIPDNVYGVCFVPSKTGMYCRWYNQQKGSRLIPVCPPGLIHFWPQPLNYKCRTVA